MYDIVLKVIQKVISDMNGSEDPSLIKTSFSFSDNRDFNEDMFYEMLEKLEIIFDVKLIRFAWKFEDVNKLVNYVVRLKE